MLKYEYLLDFLMAVFGLLLLTLLMTSCASGGTKYYGDKNDKDVYYDNVLIPFQDHNNDK